MQLAEYGVSSFGFDFSGHGKSTGKLYKSSLLKRTQEAKSAIRLYRFVEPITICGSSMGGHIALELLKSEKVDNLILFCPAVYDKEAFSVPFNKGFSEIIRKKESWKRADVFQALSNFTGNLLICIGEKDEIIPSGVIEAIDKYSKRVRNKEIITIPNVSHQIHLWLSENLYFTNHIAKKIVELL